MIYSFCSIQFSHSVAFDILFAPNYWLGFIFVFTWFFFPPLLSSTPLYEQPQRIFRIVLHYFIDILNHICSICKTIPLGFDWVHHIWLKIFGLIINCHNLARLQIINIRYSLSSNWLIQKENARASIKFIWILSQTSLSI